MNKTELVTLINSLNEISYPHEKLMTIVLDFDEIYKKQYPENSDFINFVFNKGPFIQQAVLCAREALVLGTQSICLGEHVPFEQLIESCINLELQNYHLGQLKLHIEQEKIIIDFFNYLRREIYSRINSQNKSFRQLSEIKKEVIDDRMNTFMKVFA